MNSVTFGSLYVANCSTGIHFAPNAAGFGLTVDGTDFHQIEHPLSFRGSYLTVSQCSFNATTHGVEVSTATNVTIEQSFFYATTEDSISIASGNMDSVVVSNCTFQAAAGLIFNVPPYVEANSSPIHQRCVGT